MPLYHHVTVNGTDVSRFVLDISTDARIGQDAEPPIQNCTVNLSNSRGKFSDINWNPNFVIVAHIYSLEFESIDSSNLYTELVFTGKLQDVVSNSLVISINASTTTKNTGSTLKKDIKFTGGNAERPMVDLLEQNEIQYKEIKGGDVACREWVYPGNMDGGIVMQDLLAISGCEALVDEHDIFHLKLPENMTRESNVPDGTGRMQVAEKSDNEIGAKSKTVTSSEGFIPVTADDYIVPGAEIPTTDRVVRSKPNTPALADGKTLVVCKENKPECRAIGNAQKLSNRKIEQKSRFFDNPNPTIVGRHPHLATHFEYSGMNRMENAGRIVAVSTDYSKSGGWTATLEIDTGEYSTAAAAEGEDGSSDGSNGEESNNWSFIRAILGSGVEAAGYEPGEIT